MMERYPEWSDKYSVQILVAIGGGGWKDYFKLSEDHDTNGFLAKLTYPSNEHIYKVCSPTFHQNLKIGIKLKEDKDFFYQKSSFLILRAMGRVNAKLCTRQVSI